MLRDILCRSALLPLLLLAIGVRASAQETFFPDEEELPRSWVASAGVGVANPFGGTAYATEWSGRQSLTATLEYYPHRDVSFGVFGMHTMYDHTGETSTGHTPCMLGLTRQTTGGGLVARVHAVRWSGVSLTLGGNVGALNVTRERPLLRRDGTAYGKIDLPSSVDLGFGLSFGIETTLLPGASLALEGAYEGVDNQITLAQTLVARTSIRVGL